MMTTSMDGQILQTKDRDEKRKISGNSGLDGVLNED